MSEMRIRCHIIYICVYIRKARARWFETLSVVRYREAKYVDTQTTKMTNPISSLLQPERPPRLCLAFLIETSIRCHIIYIYVYIRKARARWFETLSTLSKPN